MDLFYDGDVKKFRSENYNYDFNMITGHFERWGKSKKDDPSYSEFGPEILDIEISSICSFGCKFCYKSNTPNGKHMSFDSFKSIIDKFPKYNDIHSLTQIAFGAGDIDASEDLWFMMRYCRENKIVPNITINGDRLTDNIVDNLSSLCGAIAVSRYQDKNICYNAVKTLTDKGMDQINIHQLVCEETYSDILETLGDIKTDPRLKKINAIVFLSLKQKGRGKNHTRLSDDKFANIIKICLKNSITFGFDSCGANKCAKVMGDLGILSKYEQYIEPCESAAFSSYISVDGMFYPCSFADKETGGIDLNNIDDFLKDLWHNKNTCLERKRIQDNGRRCPYFNV